MGVRVDKFINQHTAGREQCTGSDRRGLTTRPCVGGGEVGWTTCGGDGGDVNATATGACGDTGVPCPWG